MNIKWQWKLLPSFFLFTFYLQFFSCSFSYAFIYALFTRFFSYFYHPLLANTDNIDVSNNDINIDDSNKDNNNNIIYDINNKDIYRKPKRKTNWLQECLKENARKYGCYTLNQQWQDEHKVGVETSAVSFFVYFLSTIFQF